MRITILSLILALCGAVGPVSGQVPEPQDSSSASREKREDADETPQKLSEVKVTGTRIVRNGFQSPTPTTVLSADDIALTAPANIADAVNRLPQLGLGLVPTNENGSTSTGIGGLNALNLRNLGPTRALVLVDGQRIAPSLAAGIVDVNNIPQQLVERVDVVTGGASAVYGSDAVAGVVNFVLNTKFTGFMTDLEGGITSYGDGGTKKLAVTFGTGFADSGHFIISGEYADQHATSEVQSRSWFNGTKLVGNPIGGGPALVVASDVNVSNAAPGGLILNSPANGPVAGTQFGPGGAPSQFNFGTPSGTGGLMIGGERNDLVGYMTLSPALSRSNLFAMLTYDLTADTVLGIQGSFGESRDNNPTVYQFKLGNLVISGNNPFLPLSVAQQMASAGVSNVTFGTWNQDIGPLQVFNRDDIYRGVVSLDGKLGGSWTFDSYYQYGRTDALNRVANDTITANYNQASNAVRDPVTGKIACSDPANGCVPLDVIGTGVASAEAISWVTGTARRNSKLEEQVASISFQGIPLSTWAGPASVALGGEYRVESSHESVDPVAQARGYFAANFQPVDGSYNVKEGFFETVIPLAKDMQFAKSLELNGAVRATDYSTSGYVTTWKLGGTWEPLSELLFRATRSQDIRAPNLNDLYANTPAVAVVTDPFNGNRLEQFTGYISSGNPALKPEVAQNITIGTVYRPDWFSGFQASFDYYRIDISDFITAIASSYQQLMNLCFAGSAAACSLIARDASGNVTSIRLAGVNAGSLITSGFDIEASYRRHISGWKAGGGQVSVRALATRLNELRVDTSLSVHEYASELAGGSPILYAGAAFPHWRGLVTATYEQAGIILGVSGRYIGRGVFDTTYTPATIASNNIASVFYTDLSADYRLEHVKGRPQIYFAIDNVFNRAPPAAPANSLLSSGTNPGLYDVLGTVFRAGIRAEF